MWKPPPPGAIRRRIRGRGPRCHRAGETEGAGQSARPQPLTAAIVRELPFLHKKYLRGQGPLPGADGSRDTSLVVIGFARCAGCGEEIRRAGAILYRTPVGRKRFCKACREEELAAEDDDGADSDADSICRFSSETAWCADRHPGRGAALRLYSTWRSRRSCSSLQLMHRLTTGRACRRFISISSPQLVHAP